jgi:HTH-type transcriptional regulator/antitoxin HigA
MEGRLRLLRACPPDAGHEIQSGADKAKESRNLTMTTKTKFRLTGKSRDSYLELVVEFPLASIKSDEHLAEAQRVIDGLLARGTLHEGEETYLDALSDLVSSYEDEHHAIEPASDADMLRHLMEAKGVSQMQLSRDTGMPKSTISEVLAGKKNFSRQMIRKLADYFHVDVGVLAANI